MQYSLFGWRFFFDLIDCQGMYIIGEGVSFFRDRSREFPNFFGSKSRSLGPGPCARDVIRGKRVFLTALFRIQSTRMRDRRAHTHALVEGRPCFEG